jgi:hypothetical protein
MSRFHCHNILNVTSWAATKPTLSAMLFLVFSTHSFASIVTYTDQNAFQAAVAGGVTTTLDFEPSADPFDYFTLAYEDDYGPSTGAIDSTYDTTSGDNYLSLGDGAGFWAGSDFTLTFNQTWQAIGLYLISSDELWDEDAILSAGAHSVSNAGSPASTLADGSFVYFLGLTDTNGFTSASLATYLDPENGQGTFAFGIDDIQLVSFAQAPAPVPEPTSLALLAIGVLMSLRLKGRRLHTNSHN